MTRAELVEMLDREVNAGRFQSYRIELTEDERLRVVIVPWAYAEHVECEVTFEEER